MCSQGLDIRISQASLPIEIFAQHSDGCGVPAGLPMNAVTMALQKAAKQRLAVLSCLEAARDAVQVGLCDHA